MFTIGREDAVALCIGIGLKTARNWDKKRMIGKLVDLSLSDEYEDLRIEEEEVPDSAERDRLNALLVGIRQSGGDIEVVKDEVKVKPSKVNKEQLEEEVDEDVKEEQEDEQEDEQEEVDDEEEEEEEEQEEVDNDLKEEKEKKKTSKKQQKSTPPVSNKKEDRVRKTRFYLAGTVLKKHGLDKITDEMVNELEGLYDGKSNPAESKYVLTSARHALNGYTA